MMLTDTQRMLVENNMGLVGSVLAQHVHHFNGIGAVGYDDLYQVGCIGLCKAAASYKPQGSSFSVYACIVIRNEIYDALASVSRSRGRETALDELIHASPAVEEQTTIETVCSILGKAKTNMDGISARGVEALQLKAQGFSSAEIGDMYGVSANNVTAWIARARKKLKQDTEFMDRLAMGA